MTARTLAEMSMDSEPVTQLRGVHNHITGFIFLFIHAPIVSNI